MKKKVKKLVLAKETVRILEKARNLEQIAGGGNIPRLRTDDTRSVYWSCVCTGSGMYTCAC